MNNSLRVTVLDSCYHLSNDGFRASLINDVFFKTASKVFEVLRSYELCEKEKIFLALYHVVHFYDVRMIETFKV